MKKGFMLVAIYGVVAVLTILGGSLLVEVVSEKRHVDMSRRELQALYIAESGADAGFLWLRDQSSPPAGTDPLTPSGLQGVDLEFGTFSVVIDPYDTNPATSQNRYTITATADIEGIQKTVSMDVMTDTFARYAYFTDDEHQTTWWWKTPVWFVSGDVLSGPVHTNSHLHVSGDPGFFDIVAISDVNDGDGTNDGVYYMHGGPPQDNPHFEPGYPLTAVDPVPMPSQATNLKNASQSGGLYLTGNTTIILYDDGTMGVTNAAEGWTNENMALPANGAVYVDNGDVAVSGTLSGQLSIGSEDDIIIADNILYADDPRVDSTSTDMLALIAENDVVVDSSAPYNLEIDASIMAMADSFFVENYANPPAKGTLTVLGGIIQDQRGAVGTFNSTTGSRVSGYSKNYIYDTRLQSQNPPYYPDTGDYVVILWQRN